MARAARVRVRVGADGTVTRYAYDAAGRMVKEGAKVYRYGYLDKVLSVTGGGERRTFTYHADGQLATAAWHPAAKAGGPRSVAADALFTGKPHVDGLGYAFLFRNYRADLGKWQTAAPLGYPDGWNQMAYGVNSPVSGIDFLGASWGNWDFVEYYFNQDQARPDYVDTDEMGLTGAVLPIVRGGAEGRIDLVVRTMINATKHDYGHDSTPLDVRFPVDCGSVVWAMGGGIGSASGTVTYNWGIRRFWHANHLYEQKLYNWHFGGSLAYSDAFKDPMDILNLFEGEVEVPGGRPYQYGHTWASMFLDGQGIIWSRMIE